MPNSDSVEWGPAQEAGLTHAWSWFSVHASQRLQMFNFFSVTTAFLVAALVSAHGDSFNRLAGAIALAGAAASVAFNMLELRTRSLVKASETPLIDLEGQLAELTGVGSLRIVESVDRPGHRATKYSFVINVVQRSAAVAWAVAAVVEFSR